MSTEKSLTIEAIIELWENRFLPSIRNEIKAELSELRSEVNVLTAKCKDIETSQQFLSNEFDNFKKIMHDNKKQTADLSKKVNIVETRIEKAEESNYAANVALDNLEQYGRRECIEISGIPTLPIDNPKQLTVELGHLMGVEITRTYFNSPSLTLDKKSKGEIHRQICASRHERRVLQEKKQACWKEIEEPAIRG